MAANKADVEEEGKGREKNMNWIIMIKKKKLCKR
jgi:hypothetical protein